MLVRDFTLPTQVISVSTRPEGICSTLIAPPSLLPLIVLLLLLLNFFLTLMLPFYFPHPFSHLLQFCLILSLFILCPSYLIIQRHCQVSSVFISTSSLAVFLLICFLALVLILLFILPMSFPAHPTSLTPPPVFLCSYFSLHSPLTLS